MEQATMHYDAVEFGKRIRAIRKKNKMTQEKLASLLYISEESVSDFENGKTMCMPEHITQMCQIFNVSADYFYFGKKSRLQEIGDIEHICQRLKECDAFDLSRIEQMINILLAKPAA